MTKRDGNRTDSGPHGGPALEWDERKRRSNLARHGVDFTDAALFDLGGAVVVVDDRRDYGEVRLSATGLIGTRLHVMTFTYRGDRLRVINLRKCNKREVRRWDALKRSPPT